MHPTSALDWSIDNCTVQRALQVGLIAAASFTTGALQGALWALALVLDMGEPYLFGSEGWKLAPGHFDERHGLIVIIALGESIVAIGVGAEGGVDAGAVADAVRAKDPADQTDAAKQLVKSSAEVQQAESALQRAVEG